MKPNTPLFCCLLALMLGSAPADADPQSLRNGGKESEEQAKPAQACTAPGADPRLKAAKLFSLKARPGRQPEAPRSWIRVRPAPPPRVRLGPRRSVGWGGGETLTFAVKLAGVHAGRAAISVGRPGHANGRTVLKLRGLGETVPFISAFARMREEVVTQVNLHGLLPLHSTTDRQSSEPGKNRWMNTRFGPPVRQLIKKKGRKLNRQRRIQGPLHDPISALFALRSAHLRKGLRLRMLVLNGNSLYEVKLKVVGRERIYTKLGPRTALRIDGLGRRVHDDGQRPVPGKPVRSVSLWLGTGHARIPLKLRGDTKLGPIEATITSHRPSPRGLEIRVALAR